MNTESECTRCEATDETHGRCLLDTHDGHLHAYEGVAGPPGPPQRWQTPETPGGGGPLRVAVAQALTGVAVDIAGLFPLNGELRHDGTADPTASAYVEGLHDAHAIVTAAARAALAGPHPRGGQDGGGE